MKSDETLARLSKNPHYTLSAEEKVRLEAIESSPKKVSSIEFDLTKKKVTETLGNATVKEIGKLNKHSSDPVSE